MFMFQERFRNEGGKFFDANTMKATVNSPIGVKVFTEMRNENRFMPPGVEKFGFVENLAVFLQGRERDDDLVAAVRPLRRGLSGQTRRRSTGCRSRTIAGKVGYALPPGGHPELAAGFALSVASTSKQKEQAYLFIQWLNSEEISNQRVQLPYTLRDPFRDSHFTNPGYLELWPDAKDYLAALQAGVEDRPARPVADPDRQVRGGAAPGHQPPVGRRRSARRSSTTWPSSGTRSPSRSASTSRRPSTTPGPPSPARIRSKR